MYNLLIGGAAGQGIDTSTAILEQLLKRAGYFVYTIRDFMSRVRGGHNFSLIRFGPGVIRSHSLKLNGIIALTNETIELHKDELEENGFILCDKSIAAGDKRELALDTVGIAKDLGNARAAGNVALGAALKLFGEKLDGLSEVLQKSMKASIIDVNIKAIRAGYDAVEPRFKHLNGHFENTMTITGSRAQAFGAIAAGLKFYAAYPMSPSTPIMEALAEAGERTQLVVEQAEDEIAAVNMAIGASYAGARAMTGTSGGGFSLMAEGLGLAGITETPLVITDVQRPGPATGFPTRTEQGDLKFLISASQGEFPRMVMALKNHTDAFYQTHRALNLAEKYQMPVLILSDQYLGDSSSSVGPFDLSGLVNDWPAEEAETPYRRYRVTDSGISPRLIPGKSDSLVLVDSDEHDEQGRITEAAGVRIAMADKRMRKLKLLEEEDLQEPEFIGSDTFDTLLLGFGSAWGPIYEAVELLNNDSPGKYAALVFGDVWPLPTKRLTEKTAAASALINVEQNATGQLALLIREQTGITMTGSVLKYDGRQISGEEIAERIGRGELS